MSTIIGSAAYFLVCPDCGKTGRVVTATGEKSQVRVSKRHARVTLRELVASGKISKDEVGEVENQINTSNLPSTHESLEALVDHIGKINANVGNSLPGWEDEWRCHEPGNPSVH